MYKTLRRCIAAEGWLLECGCHGDGTHDTVIIITGIVGGTHEHQTCLRICKIQLCSHGAHILGTDIFYIQAGTTFRHGERGILHQEGHCEIIGGTGIDQRLRGFLDGIGAI